MMVTSMMSEGLYLAFGLGDARREKNGSMAVDSLPQMAACRTFSHRFML